MQAYIIFMGLLFTLLFGVMGSLTGFNMATAAFFFAGLTIVAYAWADSGNEQGGRFRGNTWRPGV